MTVPELHSYLQQTIDEKRKAVVLNLNVHAVYLALRHPWLYRFFQEVPLVFCDGDGVRWAVKMLGQEPPVKITYDRWMWQLADFCEEKGYSLYLLGSAPGVAEAAGEKLKARFPRLKIAGSFHGFFQKEGEENQKILDQINAKKTDILVVGFGMPLQEKWIMENWRKIDARIFLSGGAVFEWVTGVLPSPPEWMVRLQLEWFYCFLRQPVRRFSRYFLEIPYVFFKVLKERFKKT